MKLRTFEIKDLEEALIVLGAEIHNMSFGMLILSQIYYTGHVLKGLT